MHTSLRWYLLPIITIVSALFLASCGNDPKDEPQPPVPETPVGPSNPEINEPSNPYKLLTDIVKVDLNLDITLHGYHVNSYEVNKWSGYTVVTSMDPSSYGDPWDYTYNLPYSIEMSLNPVKLKMTLNTYQTFVMRQEEIAGREPSYDYVYDSKARLIEESSSANSRVVYTYDDKTYNITKITEYNDGKVQREAQFFYNDIKAKTIPLQVYCINSNQFNLPGSYNTPLYEGGFYGVSIPTNLISRIILKQPYLNDFETEYTYDYKLDKDGYVAEMTEHRYDNTETFIHIYRYTWEPLNKMSYTNWLFNDIRSPYYRILFN